MELNMNRLKILSTVALLALTLPVVSATDSFAQGHYRGGGGYYGGHRGGGGGAFLGGAIAGAVIGGALAAPYGGYGYGGYGYGYGPGYYAAPVYGPGYDEEPLVEVAPGGGDDVNYCIQRFRSYDPRSGTYLGNDGYRHACP
jgi:hypothetical protein